MTSLDRVRPAAITARGWGWRHAGRSRPAVSGLDLDIQPGERVLLLGPSGAGKSTLLHALAGVLGDSSSGDRAADRVGDRAPGDAEDADETGSLLIDGAPPRARRGRAGLMQQDPETQVVLSRVGDDVAFGAENLSVPPGDIWTRVAEALDDVGLGRLPLDHPTAALSGGQKQRLALAGILAMRPGLVLLDEPTANLDPAGILEVRDAVGRCLDKTGATLVVVEHRVSVWKDLVDRIVVLQPGSATDSAVLIDGPPDQVLAQTRDMLTAAGVWVPGYVPQTRARRTSAATAGAAAGADTAGRLLLAAEDLAVSRERPRRSGLRGGFRPIPPAPVQSGIMAQVRAGEALTITGPNGSGKSTFALTLAGLLAPVSGTVSATLDLSAGAGIDPYKWKAQQLIARIGTVFQEPEHQFVTGRVLDELMFGPRHLGRGEERVDELLERLRLTDLVDANPYTLSGGEKRRLSVATVLAAHPHVLILDEPTFGQDANTWAELASLLSELLDDGTAVVSVTHDAEFSEVLGGTELSLRAPEHREPRKVHAP